MALPTKSDLETMDYAFRGSPMVYCAGNATPDLNTMDWANRAQPFVVNPEGGGSATSIKVFMGVAQASIKKASAVTLANIKQISGVSNVT